MAMYSFTISGAKAGITRLRNKGGASSDSFWDMVNCQRNAAGDVEPRFGNRLTHTLPAGTVGLTVFKGKRVVFADHFVAMTDPKYRLEILPYTGPVPGSTLIEIHFAEPLAGNLFVVAEFSDGWIEWYWLVGDVTGGDVWQADHIYFINDLVRPVTANGNMYRAQRLNPPDIAWQPGVLRTVGDRIEPTVYNGYYYLCIEASGATPNSGTVEPVWPTAEGATISESTDFAPEVPTGDPPVPEDPGDGGGGGGGPRYPTNPYRTQAL